MSLFGMWIVYCVFFFSSRRRHTRLTCDWSSDVALPISPGRLGRLLLGRLLGAPLAGPEHLAADPDHGAERLLVIGAALLDLVVGDPEHLDRGELLQRGLPVQARA